MRNILEAFDTICSEKQYADQLIQVCHFGFTKRWWHSYAALCFCSLFLCLCACLSFCLCAVKWSVDANAAWSAAVAREALDSVLKPYAHRIFMVEQPFPVTLLEVCVSVCLLRV